MNPDSVRLTELASCAGWASKFSPDDLAQVLSQLPIMSHPDLLIGSDTKDDAAVFKITDDIALIFTVDFFPPIVDDPYTFGQIAASNALSDIYAMGGKPMMALNIVGFPIDLPKEILTNILKGGADKIQEAGAIISGGHTVAGDFLVLTKSLGTGIITTAAKQTALDDIEILNFATTQMKSLNQNASISMVNAGANACTDITGYGLIGHLHEICKSSNLSSKIYYQNDLNLFQVLKKNKIFNQLNE